VNFGKSYKIIEKSENANEDFLESLGIDLYNGVKI
jgi:hypothetical protein